MNRKNEKGVALILALMLLLVMSVMAVSLMFISQTETWSSLNYRLMDQARDGAEAGINAAANYIINSYTAPASTGGDLLSNYNSNVTPVQYPATSNSGKDVILAATGSNYPVASDVTAFNGIAQGSLNANNATVNYTTSATLLSQRQVIPWTPLGLASPVTVQTWKITSDGTISGIRAADEQVSAILEQQVSPVFSYAAFATAQGCGSLNFGGGGTTDSYDSSAALGSNGSPVISASDGSVGTNGNLAENGNPTTINGTLSTPRTGVGTCTSGNVTAWTAASGQLKCGTGLTGAKCLVDLPQQVTYPNPDVPTPVPPSNTGATLNNTAGDCSGISGAGSSTGCTYDTSQGCAKNDFCLAPGGCPQDSPAGTPATYGNITVKGNLHLSKGCYNINSLVENGQGSIIIDPPGPVVINIAGYGPAGPTDTPLGTPISLTGGGTINNASFSSTSLEIEYAGTGTVNLKGGANAVGLIYAPNASASFAGGAAWYGSVIMASMSDLGGGTIHYDRNLEKTAASVSKWMLDSFTWKKY